MSMDECIEFINDDEMVEVTPESVRMRKKVLKKDERQKVASASKKAE
jgi:GTP-binding protein